MGTSTMPQACLRDLTDEIIRQCKEQASFEGYSWRAAITQSIEQVAILITCRLNGDNIYMSAMRWPVPFVDILIKHGLLAKT
jgi:hypothetical protein